jgi:hypothetical protein
MSAENKYAAAYSLQIRYVLYYLTFSYMPKINSMVRFAKLKEKVLFKDFNVKYYILTYLCIDFNVNTSVIYICKSQPIRHSHF